MAARFVSILKERQKAPQEEPRLWLFADRTHSDAMELASTLSIVGTQGGWYVPVLSDPRRATGPAGLILEIGKNRESDAAVVLHALKQIGLPDPRQANDMDEILTLWIGRRTI